MIIEIDYSIIKPFASVAAKDRVSISETKNTEWFVYGEKRKGETFFDLKQPSFCASMKVANGYRIKGVWVYPNKRGHGLGEDMTLNLLDYLQNVKQACRVEAFAYNPDFYEKHKFKRYGTLPNGAVKVERLF